MSKRLSFNVNGQQIKDKNKFFNFMGSYRPTTVLIMQDPNVALQTYDVTEGQTKIVHRFWSENESSEWSWLRPVDWVRDHINWGHPEIYRCVLNEPGISNETLPGLLKWLMDVMDELANKGYRGVFGNFSVGSFSPEQIDGGLFDDYLKKIYQYRNWHYFGIHEYTAILLPFGVGQWPASALLDKQYVQPEAWISKSALPIQRWEMNGKKFLPPYWHILRSAWFTIRSQELGLAVPDYWMTEFGWDDLPDISGQPDSVYRQLERRFGIPQPYLNIRCINTLQRVWEYYFRDLGWSHQRAGWEQLKWADSIYPDNYIGFNLFTWSNAHDWREQFGCDYADLDELHSYMKTSITAPTPIPTPTPTPEPIYFPDISDNRWRFFTIKPTHDFANIRANFNVTSSKVGLIEGLARLEILKEENRQDKDGFTWFPIKIGQVNGWVRSDVFEFVGYPLVEDMLVERPTDTELLLECRHLLKTLVTFIIESGG